jgi:CRISPR system Cascade subunit CasB
MTDTIDESPPEGSTKPPAAQLAGFVQRQASVLSSGYLADRAAAVATMARLRHAVPTQRWLDTEIWDVLEGLPADLIGRGDEPSAGEFAAGASLCLFALHHQSVRDRSMHQQGSEHRFGRAVGQLALRTDTEGVHRRFQALTRPTDIVPALQHLRALISQLRSERIPLDYADLARDLYFLQFPTSARGVRVRWTRDFHRPAHSTEQPDQDTTTGDPA